MDEVKEKMHNPARAKCECVSLTETIARVIPGTKQEFDEDLADCAKRLKQAKDVFKQSVDTKMSFEFVVHTQEHKDAGSNAAAQESCERRGIQQMDDPFVCEELFLPATKRTKEMHVIQTQVQTRLVFCPRCHSAVANQVSCQEQQG